MQSILDHQYDEYVLDEAYQHLPDKHVLWMDVCSLIVLGDTEKSERVLEWIHANVRGPWHWTVRHRHVGNSLALLDVRLELWVSIDDSDSAMLSKLTWMEFRSKEHADD
jgi:hypothetical protein